MDENKTLIQILQEQRKYAHHFEWPDKQIKEKGVVESLLEEMGKHDEALWDNLKVGPHPNHAPDCVATNHLGEAVAIEVTELVSGEAIEITKAGRDVYRNWRPEEVIAEIQKRITRKDSVTYYGGPYASHVLVIHTDEIVLNHETYRQVLAQPVFSATTLNDVYFLFSYCSQVKGYPYVRLRLTSNHGMVTDATQDSAPHTP